MTIRCRWPTCGCEGEVCDDHSRSVASGEAKKLGDWMYVSEGVRSPPKSTGKDDAAI